MSDELNTDEDEGGGAPGWIMTFADLMSLLLAFFVLLFSFSSIDDELYKEVGGSMKDAFGVQSRVQLAGPVLGHSLIFTEFSSGRPDPKMLNVLPQDNLDQRKIYETDKPPGYSNHKDKNEGSPDKIEKAKEQQAEALQQQAEAMKLDDAEKMDNQDGAKKADEGASSEGESRGLTQKDFSGLNKEEKAQAQFAAEQAKELGDELAQEIANGNLNVETQGNKVIIRIADDASFAPGTADTTAPFQSIVGKIGDVVKDSPGRVVVEGHTDNRPINSEQYRSNWELSAARAVTVTHGLINATGLPENRFEVKGLADTRPIADNEKAIGRAKNRRVEVILEYNALDLIPDEIRPEAEAQMEKPGEEKAEAAEEPQLDDGFEESLKRVLPPAPEDTEGPSSIIFPEGFF